MNSYSVMTDLAAAEGLASAALSASFPQSLGAVVGALDDPQAPARALDWMKQNYALASAALFACAQLCNRAAAALDDDAAAQQPTGTAGPRSDAGDQHTPPGRIPHNQTAARRHLMHAASAPRPRSGTQRPRWKPSGQPRQVPGQKEKRFPAHHPCPSMPG